MDDFFAIIAENRIREAIERGVLSNLPGEGKPLELEDFTGDPARRIAVHILKSAGMLPPWVEEAKAIDELDAKTGQMDTEFAAWLRREAGVLRAALPAQRPALGARFRTGYRVRLNEYRRHLAGAQARKQAFNYSVPALSLEKSWPSIPLALRSREAYTRHVLAEALNLPADAPDIIALIAPPDNARD